MYPIIYSHNLKWRNTETIKTRSMPNGIEGIRQNVIVTHNPSEIDKNQLLLVRFPNLGNDDIIIPGMSNLSFNIELTSTADPNRTLVSNIGRAIIKNISSKVRRE